MTRKLVLAFLMIVTLVNGTTAQNQTATKPVGVGTAAPDFTLLDQHGNRVSLSDEKGKNRVVLVFYRGYW